MPVAAKVNGKERIFDLRPTPKEQAGMDAGLQKVARGREVVTAGEDFELIQPFG